MAAADHNLLFGLLALQVGLIDQDQLIAAFRAWTRDKARPMADHLVSRGDLNPEQRDGVEAMVGLHLKMHGGNAETSLAAVPLAPATRRTLAGAAGPELEATLGHLDGTERTATYAAGDDEDAARFRILRPHARGGLGAVFVALDTELHREVALKQILEKYADDPSSRQRFVTEAEVTGNLEHPGVVPVYALGTHEDGRPFYAMRFVKGDSLKEAIERFHADESLKNDPGARTLARLALLRRFIDVCNAVGYAHSRGILHRDIKPANIILGHDGETLLVDWGLAKAVGYSEPRPDGAERPLVPASASGSSETLPGSALGTPAYMSPEQAAGELDRLGPRSDVYSLGATLYCLVTGKPPFDGEALDVVPAVQRGEFPPPRQVNPRLDRALEAVCLRAMAMKQEDRYPSARALAEEVERWMADEPVTAYAEPLVRRARRWAKQNRTAFTALAAAVLVALAGTAAVLVVQTQANADLNAANADLNAANARTAAANAELLRSKAAVQARYDLAVEAIKTLHTGVSEDFLLKEEQFKELRHSLLKSAADFYGKLGALIGKETDIASRRALAASNFELAELTEKIGRKEEALAAHRSVLAAREALANDPGAEPATVVDVGRSLTAVARLLDATGKTDEALAACRRSESLLAGRANADASARAALADCRSKLGYLLFTTGKAAEALATSRQARSDQEALASAPRSPNDARRDLAGTVDLIGIVLALTGQPDAAESEFRAALAIRQKLADDNPAVNDFRYRLAQSHNNLGILLWETGQSEAAEAEHRRALAVFQQLADANPAVTGFRHRLAQSHTNLGGRLWQTGQAEAAEAELRRALALFQKLTEDHPTAPDYRTGLAAALISLGDVVRALGRSAEARDDYDRAIALRERLVHDDATTTVYRSYLAYSLRRRGLALRKLGEVSGSAADARRALGLYDGLPTRSGEDWFETGCCHAALSGLPGRDGSGVSAAEAATEADAAMALLHKAVVMGYRNAAAFRTDDALDPLRDRDDFKLLMLDLAMPAKPFARAR
jgi:serine/threonine-protein kinase